MKRILVCLLFSFFDFAVSSANCSLNGNARPMGEDIKISRRGDFCVMPLSYCYFESVGIKLLSPEVIENFEKVF